MNAVQKLEKLRQETQGYVRPEDRKKVWAELQAKDPKLSEWIKCTHEVFGKPHIFKIKFLT